MSNEDTLQPAVVNADTAPMPRLYRNAWMRNYARFSLIDAHGDDGYPFMQNHSMFMDLPTVVACLMADEGTIRLVVRFPSGHYTVCDGSCTNGLLSRADLIAAFPEFAPLAYRYDANAANMDATEG